MDICTVDLRSACILQGQTIRLAFNTVRGEFGQEHHEITGRLPELNANLQKTLASVSPGVDLLMTKITSSLLILADFCQQFVMQASASPLISEE